MNGAKKAILKPGFHIIITIVWIVVKDSSDHSDPSDLLETGTNDPNDSRDRDRWEKPCSISAIAAILWPLVVSFRARFFAKQEGKRAHCV